MQKSTITIVVPTLFDLCDQALICTPYVWVGQQVEYRQGTYYQTATFYAVASSFVTSVPGKTVPAEYRVWIGEAQYGNKQEMQEIQGKTDAAIKQMWQEAGERGAIVQNGVVIHK